MRLKTILPFLILLNLAPLWANLKESNAIKPLSNLNEIDRSKLSLEENFFYFQLKKLDPNFLVEIDLSLPVKPGEEDAKLQRVSEILNNFTNYGTIPYYSKQNDTWNDLFKNPKIIESQRENGTSQTLVGLTMIPFTRGEFLFTQEISDESILFSCTNTTPLKYSFIKALKAQKMEMTIVVTKKAGQIKIWGLGGAKSWKGLGMEERLEQAFNGRIEAFYLWFLDQLNPSS